MEARRLLISSYASAQALLGAHYLKGGWGATPGSSESGRPVKLLENTSSADLAIHTAKNGLQTCYGRWGSVPGGCLVKPKSEQEKSLEKYLKDNKSTPVESWPPFESEGLFPRRLKSTAIALGEDCRGKRHFDCIGFIYWVLRQVNPSVGWSNHGIQHYQRGFKQVEELGHVDSDVLISGDIVTRTNSTPEHIGFYIGLNKVVEASIENRGVIFSDYVKTNWTGAGRVKSEYL